MKIIKYLFNGKPVEMGWNEVNEELAKREADNGDYTVDDIEQPEDVQPSESERIANLEEALDMLLSGVTE